MWAGGKLARRLRSPIQRDSMSSVYELFISNKKVGDIHDLGPDWPAVIGRFVPADGFNKWEPFFREMAQSISEHRMNAFHENLQAVFDAGVEVRTADGVVVFRRSGPVGEVGEIATMRITPNYIAFRTISPPRPRPSRTE
jgi:hypothetical protein